MNLKPLRLFKGVFGACLLIGLIFGLINPTRAHAEDPTIPLGWEEPNPSSLLAGEDRAGGTISGTVTCLGFISNATNEVFVDLHTNVELPPVGDSIHIACNQPYQFSNIPDGTYYIGTWLDENDSGDGPPDDGEPHAWFGAPDPIEISSTTQTYTDVNLELARYVERVSLFGSKDIPQEENWDSEEPAISGDGRYVVFSSDQGYPHSAVHIFDRELNTSTWFSESGYFDFFYAPDISADGNYVAAAYFYHPYGEDPTARLIVKEWADEYSTPIVIEPWETDYPVFNAPSISEDGCRVAFEFIYDDGDIRDVFLYDCITEDITLISVAVNGTDPGDGMSKDPAISDDGFFVAFKSSSINLIDPQPPTSQDRIYVRDIAGDTTEIIPFPVGFSDGYFNGAPSISADGRFVAFQLDYDIFVYDRDTGTSILIPKIDSEILEESYNPSISGDGRFITYETFRYIEEVGYFCDIVVYDLESGNFKIATKGFDGNPDLYSEIPVISTDGRFVAFQSEVSDLVVDDTNGTRDVFVYMNAPSLAVDIIGNGSVPHQSTYAFDEVVTLTPMADEGFAFDGWSGEDAADLVDNLDGTWSITMDEDKSITANFYALPVVSLSRADYGSLESGPNVTIVVEISGDRQHDVTIDYATADGTATADEDYAATSGTLTLLPTDQTQAFTVDILEDTLYEGIEHFNVTISNPVGATLGEPSSAVVSITDNDPEPVEDFNLFLPLVLK